MTPYEMLLMVGGLVAGILLALIGSTLYLRARRRNAAAIIADAEVKSAALLKRAGGDADQAKAAAVLEGKMEALRLREESERDLSRRREDADRVERDLRVQHEQGHPADADGRGDERAAGRALTEEDEGEGRDDERPDGAEHRRDAAGQPVRRHEEQGEEHADVEHTQQRSTPPPVAARQGTAPGEQRQRPDDEQTGRQGAEPGRQQRSPGRQQFGGDQEGRAPQSGGDRARADGAQVSHEQLAQH